MNKKNKVVIVDGTSMMVDAYHESLTDEVKNATNEEEKELAYQTLEINENGEYIGAIRIFFEMLLDVVDNLKPTHMAVVWGTSRANNIRKEIYPKYKSDDSKMDAPLREQFGTVQKMLMSIVEQYTSKKYEAIDVAGTIVENLKDECDVSVFARNTNYLQLANMSDIYLKTSKSEKLNAKYGVNTEDIPNGFFKYDASMVIRDKGLRPEQILDFGAVVGSPSVGIPGVKGVGQATIIPLLNHYGNIDRIYEAIDMNEVNVLAEFWKNEFNVRNPINKFISYKEDAYISKRLLTINNCIFDTKVSIDDMKNTITKIKVAKELLVVGILSEEALNNYNSYGGFSNDFSFKSLVRGNAIDNNDVISQCSLEGIFECKDGKENLLQESIMDEIFCENTSNEEIKHFIRDEDYITDFNEYDYFVDEGSIGECEYIEEDEEDIEEYVFSSDVTDAAIQCDTQLSSSQDVRENGFELVSERIIRTYRCNCSPEPFIVESVRPIICCPFCGLGKKSNNENVNIPNIEDVGVNINNMNANVEVLMNNLNIR